VALLAVSDTVTVCGVEYVPDDGEIVGVGAWIRNVPLDTGLVRYP
jgi:hypothetical protein